MIHGGALRSAAALTLDFSLSHALLCEANVSTGEGEGDSQQLVQLFICLSRAYRRSLIISATGVHGRMGEYYL